MSNSEIVVKALESEGRKQVWLAKRLGLNPQTVSNKLKNDTWTLTEIMALNHILGLNLDETIITK